jgi:hypothetical protein
MGKSNIPIIPLRRISCAMRIIPVNRLVDLNTEFLGKRQDRLVWAVSAAICSASALSSPRFV